MDLQPAQQGNATVLTPAGRIDHASADGFQAALQPHLDRCRDPAAPIVLDMHRLEYISSVGLRVLMMASRQVKAQHGRIVVAGLTPLVREVFEISRFNLVFDLYDDVAAALAAQQGGGG
jgi:anti-sigma B factor antagonist/stage II sporulation protein AA (anti-sigma F factor antagonist)